MCCEGCVARQRLAPLPPHRTPPAYLKRARYTSSLRILAPLSYLAHLWWKHSHRYTSRYTASHRLATSHISGGNTALRLAQYEKLKNITNHDGIRKIFDQRYFLYGVLLIHGIVILLPFHVFITAKHYLEEHKLEKTTYADNCLARMGIVMQLPNLFFSWFNLFRGIGVQRIVWCLSCEVVIILFTVLLAMLDTAQYTFYVLTMMSIFVISVCNALFLYYVLAICSKLSAVYSGAVELGSNLCGILVVIVNMLTDRARSHKTSTVYYFIIVLVVLLGCLFLFLALPLNGIYHHSIRLSKKREPLKATGTTGRKTVQKKGEVKGAVKGAAPPKPAFLKEFFLIFKEGWVHNYTLWFICFVSFSVFPAVHSDIHSMNGFDGSTFTKVTCFLTYNITAFIGSITAYLWNFPQAPRLWKFALLRGLFWPFFMFCNYRPRQQGELMKRTLPVLVRHDAIYWCAAVLLGWSMGHGCTLGMIYVGGEDVAKQHASTEGKIGAAMVVTGIFCGLCFSLLAPTVVTTSFWRYVHGGIFIGGP